MALRERPGKRFRLPTMRFSALFFIMLQPGTVFSSSA